jgi:hypothetical protein
VGHNPYPLAELGAAGISGAQHSPSRIKPQDGQVCENCAHPSTQQRCDVLHEDESGSNLANDSGHLSPEAGALAFNSSLVPGVADVLAREASRHHINNTSPRPPVEGAYVVPHGEGLQAPVVLALEEDSGGALVSFDGADGAPPKETAAENPSTSACEKSQLIHTFSSL